jgi:hypothetical protein
MPSNLAANLPIFVVCRDRVTPLRGLVAWLEKNDYRRLILVDNASTYPPLVEYLGQTPHEVVRFSDNLGPHRSVWNTGILGRYAKGEHYIVTDSDVLPDEACPGDAVDLFLWALSRYPRYLKAGFGLRVDDLPAHNALAGEVRRWESQYRFRPLSRQLYDAPIDTTFALYRPDSGFQLAPALRTGPPYLARHIPWYMDTDHRTAEEQYYRDHCDVAIANWDIQGHADVPTPRMSLKERVWWRIRLARKEPTDASVPRTYRSQTKV